jgi:hypothetical protein
LNGFDLKFLSFDRIYRINEIFFAAASYLRPKALLSR